jgi:hypothetical protein
VGATGKLRLVSQLRTEREPRKEITMALLVVSVATKPVTSDFMELFRVSDVRWCESGEVSGALLLELSECGCVCCFYTVAVPLSAQDLCVGAVVVRETV